MPMIERSDGNPTWEIEYDVNGFENSQLFQLFMQRVRELNQIEPLTQLTVKRDSQNDDLQTYKFETVDGRKWTQDFIGNGSSFVYTVKTQGAGFAEHTIQAHTALRIVVGKIIQAHQPSKIEVNWT